MFQNECTNQQISSWTTPNILWELMSTAAFSSSDKVNAESQVEILCIINSSLIELCFIMNSMWWEFGNIWASTGKVEHEDHNRPAEECVRIANDDTNHP
jgi:hypothetical protein